jgi:glycosyltransferase involved in cell wall biosynthesis
MSQVNPIDKSRIWVVIPTFNNKDTVFDVARKCRQCLEHVLVVDDGSTDTDVEKLFSGTDIAVLRHARNLGKGMAIRTALEHIHKQDAEFMLTIDADGQHDPEDIERFIPLLRQDNSAIIVGARNFNSPHIPQKSRFGRAFSNFWLKLETGIDIFDSQSGFRAYPVKYLSKIKTDGNYYDFEMEILTRAVWAGLKLEEVPVNVFYPQARSRVSSFHPFIDNLRISLMHARLIGRRFIPLPYPRVVPKDFKKFAMGIFRHPIKLLKTLLKDNSTPLDLAVSSGVAIFLGVLPLVSVHMLVIVYVTSRLHLNKIMALAIQNLCMPPFVPIACIELGHFMRYGRWLTDISWKTTFGSIPERLWEWLLGSLIFAPIMAISVAIIVYFISRAIQKRIVRYAR